MTLIDKAEALAPCPFCGGEARTYRYNGTTQATCAGNHTDCAGTDVSAPVAMWNRRAALPARGLHDPKGFLQETAHLHDCEISPSRDCTCGLSDLRALAALESALALPARGVGADLLQAMLDYLSGEAPGITSGGQRNSELSARILAALEPAPTDAEARPAGPSESAVYDRTGLPPVTVNPAAEAREAALEKEVLRLKARLWAIGHAAGIETKEDLMRDACEAIGETRA